MRNGIDYTRARARRRAAAVAVVVVAAAAAAAVVAAVVVAAAAAAAAAVFRPYALCPFFLTLCSCCLAYGWRRHVQPLSLDVESYMINTLSLIHI